MMSLIQGSVEAPSSVSHQFAQTPTYFVFYIKTPENFQKSQAIILGNWSITNLFWHGHDLISHLA